MQRDSARSELGAGRCGETSRWSLVEWRAPLAGPPRRVGRSLCPISRHSGRKFGPCTYPYGQSAPGPFWPFPSGESASSWRLRSDAIRPPCTQSPPFGANARLNGPAGLSVGVFRSRARPVTNDRPASLRLAVPWTNYQPQTSSGEPSGDDSQQRARPASCAKPLGATCGAVELSEEQVVRLGGRDLCVARRGKGVASGGAPACAPLDQLRSSGRTRASRR